MLPVAGAIIVIGSVFGGYIIANGNMHILFQPAEFLIIGGAATGGFLIASHGTGMRLVKESLVHVAIGKAYTKEDYIDLLLLLHNTMSMIRRVGLRELEKHINNPGESEIFRKYRSVYNNPRAMTFIVDILRSLATTTLTAHELDSLLENELETMYEELLLPSRSVGEVAEALPGLGIVAAVLGVVITMQNMNATPDILGHSIGAAMVGTFLGILLSYGFVGPVSRKMELIAEQHRDYLATIRVAFVAFIGGAHFAISTEFGRRVIPPSVRPSYGEMEKAIDKRIKRR